MDPSQNSLKASLKSLLTELESIKNKPTNKQVYIQRISDVEGKFHRFHEEVTPKPVLSELYTCVGRMRFYDEMLAIYFEILDNDKVQRLWPAKATWKVELVDDDDNSVDPFPLGEASCLFNKPRQGFTSHPTDWISIRYNDIRQSRLIGADNSITIKWTVLVEPVLQNIYLEEFEQLLINAERYFDFFNGGEISQIKESLAEIKNKSEEHERKISDLQNLLPEIQEKLNVIENKQDSIDGQFKTIICKLKQN
ncbi:uncharacterized protein LOC106069871 [Biomphalaria glabrata]|uniref:Uncharacterized protein LOC106069871 n=1 Tax=Biomphalaria glabrata TaxID=6526 RepID=A0A9U8EFE5_BIOGL|nr:uncharacterized protein LOC106069871 [Biomphalaria glabrata]